MIVFIDGMDGAGKTTLITNLLNSLTTAGKPALTAPPLWEFLDTIEHPHEFAAWVQRKPGLVIAEQLLTAASKRTSKLRNDIELGVIPDRAVVLVDRGPTTVLSSATAHAANDHQQPGRRVTALDAHSRDLADRVAQLTTTHRACSIHLQLDNPEPAIKRLQRHETVTNRYRDYLHRLHHELARTQPLPGLADLALPATQPPQITVDRALTWIASAQGDERALFVW